MQYYNFRNRPVDNTGATPKVMMFQKSVIRVKPRPTEPVVSQVQENPAAKKMKWGQPTWFLLHTLAEKVKDESFSTIRAELLKQVYNICTNLPCPICSTHARDYLNGINFSTIQTKDQLKMLLFTFHNEVNKNKGFPEFTFDEFATKYSSAITENIIRHFLASTKEKQYNVQLISNNAYRERILKFFIEWLSVNIQHFMT